jgi:hypothetical protein
MRYVIRLVHSVGLGVFFADLDPLRYTVAEHSTIMSAHAYA